MYISLEHINTLILEIIKIIVTIRQYNMIEI
jgi:hypothetical protein